MLELALGNRVPTQHGDDEVEEPDRSGRPRLVGSDGPDQRRPTTRRLLGVATLSLGEPDQGRPSGPACHGAGDPVGELVEGQLVHPVEERGPVAHMGVEARGPDAETQGHFRQRDPPEAVLVCEICCSPDHHRRRQLPALHLRTLLA